MMQKQATSLPRGTTAAAQHELSRFLNEYVEELNAVQQVSFTILVWGQNPEKDTPLARKRHQIKEALLADGYMALFSEEIDKIIPPRPEQSARDREYAQARHCDLIFSMIEDSPGAQGEVHDFAADPDIAPKFFVMVPKRYQTGYSGNGILATLDAGWGGVMWYEPDDIEACNLLTKAKLRANARRNIIYQRQNRGKA